jgi:hypothetical protein
MPKEYFEKTKSGVLKFISKRLVSEVKQETVSKFDELQNEQLKALMLQVEHISSKIGIDLHPAFEEALKQRSAIIEEHLEKKAQAEPD